MNTKIMVALVIAFAVVGLTGAASASSVTTGTHYDYVTGAGIGPGGEAAVVTGISFNFDIGGEDVTGGEKELMSTLRFKEGQGGIVTGTNHKAEIENTITAEVNSNTGMEDRLFVTNDHAFVDVVWEESQDGVTDIDHIVKVAKIDSSAYANNNVLNFYKLIVDVDDMSSMEGTAYVCDEADDEVVDAGMGTLKGGDFHFGSDSWALVKSEGDMLQEIFAGSGLDYEQYDWGKLESDGMIYQMAIVDQCITVNVTP